MGQEVLPYDLRLAIRSGLLLMNRSTLEGANAFLESFPRSADSALLMPGPSDGSDEHLQLRLVIARAYFLVGDMCASVRMVTEWAEREHGDLPVHRDLQSAVGASELGELLRGLFSDRGQASVSLLSVIVLSWSRSLLESSQLTVLHRFLTGLLIGRTSSRPSRASQIITAFEHPDLQALVLAYYLHTLEELHPYVPEIAADIQGLLEEARDTASNVRKFDDSVVGVRRVAAYILQQRAWLLDDRVSWAAVIRAINAFWAIGKIEKDVPGQSHEIVEGEDESIPCFVPPIPIPDSVKSGTLPSTTSDQVEAAIFRGSDENDPDLLRKSAIPRGCVWLGFGQVGAIALATGDRTADDHPLVWATFHRPDGRIEELFRPGLVPPGPKNDGSLADEIQRFDNLIGKLWRRVPAVKPGSEEEFRVLSNYVRHHSNLLQSLVGAFGRRLSPTLDHLFSYPGIDWSKTDLIIDDKVYSLCPWDMLPVPSRGTRLLNCCQSISSAMAMKLWEATLTIPPRGKSDVISCVAHFPVEGTPTSPFEGYLYSRLSEICNDHSLRLRSILGHRAKSEALNSLMHQGAEIGVILGHGQHEGPKSGISLADGQAKWGSGLRGVQALVCIACLLSRGIRQDSVYSHPYGPLLDLFSNGATLVFGYRSTISARHGSEFAARVLRSYLADPIPSSLSLARARTTVLRELIHADNLDGQPLANPGDLCSAHLALTQFAGAFSAVFGVGRRTALIP